MQEFIYDGYGFLTRTLKRDHRSAIIEMWPLNRGGNASHPLAESLDEWLTII
jgi:hypothetical protein